MDKASVQEDARIDVRKEGGGDKLTKQLVDLSDQDSQDYTLREPLLDD